MGAIALLSTSALLWVLLHPQNLPTPEEEIPYTPAQPGSTNPIAQKVLQEGGPKTPTAPSAGGLKRGLVHLLMRGENTEICLQQAISAAHWDGSTGELDCGDAGEVLIDATLILSISPVGTPGKPGVTATERCMVRLMGSRQQAHLQFEAGPGSGESPCSVPLHELAQELLK